MTSAAVDDPFVDQARAIQSIPAAGFKCPPYVTGPEADLCPLLTIQNNQAAPSGDLSIVSAAGTSAYIGCFENRFGEQWVFTCD